MNQHEHHEPHGGNDDASSLLPPPLYITIGPPCAGKTTLLQRVQQQTGLQVVDVALDDQPQVYVSVPTGFFVQEESRSSGNNATELWNTSLHGKTVSGRILDDSNAEMRAVLQRLQGKLTGAEFEKRIQSLYQKQLAQRQAPHGINNNTTTRAVAALPNNNNNNATNNNNTSRNHNATNTNATAISRHAQQLQERRNQQRLDSEMVARELVSAMEELLLLENHNAPSSVQVPKTVQLFVVESLFRPVDGLTGVERAEALLQKNASSSNIVAWGNTNTKPRDYRVALEVAHRFGRPVQFFVYGSNERIPSDDGMPQLPLSTLLRRNLQRMLQTGKYIPAQTIWDSSCRIQNLIRSAILELERPYRRKQQQEERQQQDATTTSRENDDAVENQHVNSMQHKEEGPVASLLRKRNGSHHEEEQDDATRMEEDAAAVAAVHDDDTNSTQFREEPKSTASPLRQPHGDHDGNHRTLAAQVVPPSFSKFDLERVLCRMVNYELMANGTVTRMELPPQKRQRQGKWQQPAQQPRGRGRGYNHHHDNDNHNGAAGRYYNPGRGGGTWQSRGNRVRYRSSNSGGRGGWQQPRDDGCGNLGRRSSGRGGGQPQPGDDGRPPNRGRRSGSHHNRSHAGHGGRQPRRDAGQERRRRNAPLFGRGGGRPNDGYRQEARKSGGRWQDSGENPYRASSNHNSSSNTGRGDLRNDMGDGIDTGVAPPSSNTGRGDWQRHGRRNR